MAYISRFPEFEMQDENIKSFDKFKKSAQFVELNEKLYSKGSSTILVPNFLEYTSNSFF